MKQIPGGITAPQGWQAAAVAAQIKPSGKPDLTLIYSPTPAVAAGVYTRNLVRAYSVDYDQAITQKQQPVHAIVINSGNANAATGTRGMEAVHETAGLFSSLLQIQPDQVLTASTGVIGVPLPMEKIAQAAPSLVTALSATGSDQAAEAIMTTDLVAKTLALETDLDGVTIRLGGIAKGSGMIHPDMATLLGFITCDAAVEVNLWQTLLQEVTALTFNQITVDGDTSTNDLVLALSNGQAGNALICDPDSPEAAILKQMLTEVCLDLAKKIARDGEGATKLLEVQVSGATTDQDARKVARTIAGSDLFKCALFGCDPNWGRIAAAAGRAGVAFDPAHLAVWMGDIQLMAHGEPLTFDRAAAAAYLKGDPVLVRLDLGPALGQGSAWGCDLTYDYVRINGEYTT